jgi:hypothetical protein
VRRSGVARRLRSLASLLVFEVSPEKEAMTRRPTKTTTGETVLEIRRTRRTGAHVTVEYLPWADPEQPWQTTCYTHGGVCSHTTRQLATSFAHVPEEWCEDCMAIEREGEAMTTYRDVGLSTPLTDADDYIVVAIDKRERIERTVLTGTFAECDDYVDRNESPDNPDRYTVRAPVRKTT